jgi:hypothetical protein
MTDKRIDGGADEYAWTDDRGIEERRMDEEDPLEDVRDDLDIIRSDVGSLFQGMFTLLVYLFGSSLAMVISYSHNVSIPWGIGHGLLSWGYVLYFAIFK